MAGLAHANSAQPLLLANALTRPEEPPRDAGHLSATDGGATAPSQVEQSYLDEGSSEANDSFKVR